MNGCPMKVALLIGNNKYEHIRATQLRTGVADAETMEDLLNDLGFCVVKRKDANIGEFFSASREIRRISSSREKIDQLIFGFFGHGLRDSGVDYLADVQADFDSSIDPSREMVALHRLLDDMKSTPVETQLSLIVSCRDNPLTNEYVQMGRARGTVQKDIKRSDRDRRMTRNTSHFCTVYAASEGEVAYDSMNGTENSPFVHFLLQNLRERSKSFEKVLESTRLAVEEETRYRSKGMQSPKWEANFGIGTWFLHAGSPSDLVESQQAPSIGTIIKPPPVRIRELPPRPDSF